MCTALHNTYSLKIPLQAVALGLNEIPQVAAQEDVAIDFAAQEVVAIDLDAQEVVVLDLNEIPRDFAAQEVVAPDLDAQKVVALDLNEIPRDFATQEVVVPDLDAQEAVALDLNEIPRDFAAQEDVVPDLDAQEAVALDLNLNEIPQVFASQEDVAPDLDAEEEEEDAQDVGHPKPELTNEQRFGVYFALEVIKSRDGGIETTDKDLIACMLNTSVRTVERIWAKAYGQIERNEEVDVSNQKKGNVGRKKKDPDLPRVATIPLNKRKTIRGLARSLGVSHSTLHLRFQLGDLTRHSSRLKPLITPANKLKRLEFCVSMLDEDQLTTPRPFFKKMDNIVHIDEKWFYMTKENNNYYLLPDEPRPFRTVQNKNNIGKVMFLTAVAKPRYNEVGEVTFDGKIGTWAFVQETPAQKNSKNRDKGTLELKPVKVTRDVMREYLCQKVIPAIQERWPDEDVGRTLYIQQDNAKPHLLPSDEVFRQVVAETDLDIELIQQPPNSPDMNVLDLCFFRSLQSLTDSRAPTSIKELIEDVEEEYHNYDVDKLARSFITLQYCMAGVMKVGGAIRYDPPHNKERQQEDVRLPYAISITSELLAQTKALIEGGEIEA
uniref:Uncharacterized protein n=1 Tax=Avena sativa TaxID=4498 RepID=A0ACD5XP25_AVESA